MTIFLWTPSDSHYRVVFSCLCLWLCLVGGTGCLASSLWWPSLSSSLLRRSPVSSSVSVRRNWSRQRRWASNRRRQTTTRVRFRSPTPVLWLFQTIICIHLPSLIPSITYENLYLIYSSIETYTRPIYPLYTIFTSFRRRALYKNIAKCSNFKCLHFVFSKW